MRRFPAARVLLAVVLVFPATLSAQSTAPPDLDAYVASSMKTFDVPGMAVAIVKDGKIASIVVTEPGYGYSSEPKVSVKGFDMALKTTVVYGTDLQKNGSIKEVVVAAETRGK